MFADFAVEKKGRAAFVECLTPWNTSEETVKRKLALSAFAPLWFIIEKASEELFRAYGYSFKALVKAQVDGEGVSILLARQ